MHTGAGRVSQGKRGGCTSIERPVAQASTCTAFGFADAQVDLALAEIERGFSLQLEKQTIASAELDRTCISTSAP